MHDLIRTLDLKLYSVLPGGQIYIVFFCFFYNQPVLITLFGKAPRWSEASVQICMKNTQTAQHRRSRTDDSVWIHVNSRDTKTEFSTKVWGKKGRKPALWSISHQCIRKTKKLTGHFTADAAAESLTVRFWVFVKPYLKKRAKLKPSPSQIKGKRPDAAFHFTLHHVNTHTHSTDLPGVSDEKQRSRSRADRRIIKCSRFW